MPSRITLNANGGPGSCAWSKSGAATRPRRGLAGAGRHRRQSAGPRPALGSGTDSAAVRLGLEGAGWSPRWVRESPDWRRATASPMPPARWAPMPAPGSTRRALAEAARHSLSRTRRRCCSRASPRTTCCTPPTPSGPHTHPAVRRGGRRRPVDGGLGPAPGRLGDRRGVEGKRRAGQGCRLRRGAGVRRGQSRRPGHRG